MGTTQISSAQPPTTHIHDAGQAVPAAEAPQTMTYHAASTQGAPFTYHSAMPSYGAPTVQTHSSMMYQHQYQPPYVMPPHPGLPTAQSMVAYPVGTGIPQPNMIQPEAASQAHAAAAP